MIFAEADNYSVKDFLLDESFQGLFTQPKVLIPNDLTKWLQNHPEKENCIEEARSMVLQLKLILEEEQFAEEQLEEGMNELWASIIEKVNQTNIG